ncbi:HlyD family secretion protein [Pararobbsia silviterrae]|uniref:HlyD family efflux transporter periplasmic adaptor subunit n=1 Tax=Pararobbsia silviterrae TaxID=1792498 RepID=A0A494Y269_9BURK|nr:HlyD family efflux transporter periplasmic adaptor subunit [Pararobbsia silviterrae]RKP54547.1 HlyD family efflux transporter periplasmic adaptor subunit [Pararobbsia silviterrae]
MPVRISKRTSIVVVVIAVLAAGAFAWRSYVNRNADEGLVKGNGRIEATEIDIATKLAGRVQDVLVKDGDFVDAGQTLAHMQVQTLDAQRAEAAAQHQQAVNSAASTQAQAAARESDQHAFEATVAQRQSELDAARKRLARSEQLSKSGASSMQELDDDRARVTNAQAALRAAQAQVTAAQAAVIAAQAQVTGAQSAIQAAQASIDRIDADIADSDLKAPRAGRVQYRIAQPGEVLGAGGKVLNMIDLADVYMTFFLPEQAAGRVALGQDVRIVLDAAPEYVIPAKVTFVASSAQFTPKTVETESERQKLMFRVKAQIDPALMREHLARVKTGLPGVAWIKLDSQAEWPSRLEVKVP